MKTHPLILAVIALGATATLFAQDATPPSFEVASVKRNTSGPAEGSVRVQPGGVNSVNIPLRAIVQLAYGLPQGGRVVGLRGWAESDRFDVIARGNASS